MAKYEPKTKQTKKSVAQFLNAVPDEQRKKDAKLIVKEMEKIAGVKPKMWGSSIVGFGTYHYVYKSGQEGDWPVIGFSPRSQNLTIYIMPGFKTYTEELKKLGPHTSSVSCLYIKKLDDIHMPTLRKIMRDSIRRMKKMYKVTL